VNDPVDPSSRPSRSYSTSRFFLFSFSLPITRPYSEKMKCVDPEPAAKTVARAVPDPVTDPAAVLAPVPAPATEA